LNAQQERIFFDHYSSENGLSNNEVNDIVQDEDGFIWIGTRSGLNRFDGKDFVKYYSNDSKNHLPSNDIFRVIPFKQHHLVVGTVKGIGIIDTRTGETQQLIIPSVDELKIPTNRITDLLVDNSKNIIATTYTGIYLFDSLLHLVFRYDAYSAGDMNKKRIAFGYTIDLLKNGNILIPIYKNFLVLDVRKKKLDSIDNFMGDEWRYLKQWSKKNYTLFKHTIDGRNFLIYYDAKIDSLCFGISDFEKKELVVSSIPLALKNEIFWKSRLFFINDSLFAINSSFQNGLHLFRFNARKLTVEYEKNILPKIQCNWSFIDKDDRLWVATDDGLFKQSFRKAAFHNFLIPEIGRAKEIDHNVTGFVHFHHKYFVAVYSQGLLVYDENGSFLRRISFGGITKPNLPWSINIYHGDSLLIGTQVGSLVLHADNFGMRKFWQPPMRAVVDSVATTANFLDSHNQLWMGMGSGFGVFMTNMNNRLWRLFLPTAEQNAFPLRYPSCINEDKWGNIWMSGAEGITRWNCQRQMFDTLIKKIPGLTDDFVGQWTYITTDKEGNLWISPENFILIKWNLQTNQIKIFHRPDNMQPFRSYQISGPWNKQIWVQTNIGLLCFDVATEKFTLIKKADGLPDENTIDNRVYYDSALDRIYAGFNGAFTWFHPSEVLQKKLPAATYITDIRKTGDSISYTDNTDLKFSHFNNSISLSFTGINYENGELNAYAYRLFEKKVTDWVNIGNQKTLNFTNLKPGVYTFQVKTILDDGTESLRPASIAITILPAYYQTWWFYILCILAIAGLIYMLYHYRINQLLHVQKVRNSISSDLHDDIGARLTNMNILTMLSERNLKQPDMVSAYLKRIAGEIQSSGQALDDIVWSINSRNDTMQELVARMRRHASDIFDDTNISFRFDTDKLLVGRNMLMEQRRDLFLVYKEVINNIHKHSRATNVEINLIENKKSFYLTIADNGKGFDTSQPTQRNGLKNIYNRIEKWKGKVSIRSTASEGTTITITLPEKHTNR
jgi:ligand-binding sensor domain-containing protein/two-component sensor histidine kinase